MPHTPTVSSYASLLKSIQKQITESKRVIERQTVLTYWNVGRMIAAYQEHSKDGALTGVKLYQRLGKDLAINTRVLYQVTQFASVYPRIDPKLPLSWSHYRYLSQIDSAAERKRWEKRIVREDISVHDFQVLLQAEREGPVLVVGDELTPGGGELYHYRLVSVRDISTGKARLMVDCGFENRIELPASSAKLINKYIYRSDKEDGRYTLKLAKGVTVDQIYMYLAQVERVVDGDTLLVNIDCGFGIYRREYLRLRGIDAPEQKTIAGRRAKDWVQSRLGESGRIVIKSYRSDKYDRYLADVFYQKKIESRKLKIEKPNGNAAFLNQELLTHGLAAIWKG